MVRTKSRELAFLEEKSSQLSLFSRDPVGTGREFLQRFYVEAEVAGVRGQLSANLVMRDWSAGRIDRGDRQSVETPNRSQKQPREVRYSFIAPSKCLERVVFLYDLLARFVSILARTFGFVASVDHSVQSSA